MRRYLPVLLSLVGALLWCAMVAIALAQETGPNPGVQHINPTHGFKAVMNVYWVDAKTLEIVAEDSYWFPDGEACTDAEPKGVAIANAAAAEGEIAMVECKTVQRKGDTIVPAIPGTRGSADL